MSDDRLNDKGGWYKEYPDKFLRDTCTWTLEQTGAYQKIRCIIMRDDCPVNRGKDYLKLQMHLHPRTFNRIFEELLNLGLVSMDEATGDIDVQGLKALREERAQKAEQNRQNALNRGNKPQLNSVNSELEQSLNPENSNKSTNGTSERSANIEGERELDIEIDKDKDRGESKYVVSSAPQSKSLTPTDREYFRPSKEAQEFGLNGQIHATPEQIFFEVEKFMDHYHAEGNPMDVDSKFRNWCYRAKGYGHFKTGSRREKERLEWQAQKEITERRERQEKEQMVETAEWHRLCEQYAKTGDWLSNEKLRVECPLEILEQYDLIDEEIKTHRRSHYNDIPEHRQRAALDCLRRTGDWFHSDFTPLDCSDDLLAENGFSREEIREQ